MLPLSAATAWAIEFAAVAALLAVWWGWSAFRLRRRYAELCGGVESHLLQVGATLARLWKTSRNLHGEVERLFDDPSDTAGLERLESVRLRIGRQKEFVGRLIVAPVTVESLMTDAMPTVVKSIELLEESLSTVLRQWDGAVGESEAVAPADDDDESGALLASLHKENQALEEMHEKLVASHQRATDRIRELKEDLARVGNLEADGARAGESQAPAEDEPAPATEEWEQIRQENVSLRQAVMKVRAGVERLDERMRVSGGAPETDDRAEEDAAERQPADAPPAEEEDVDTVDAPSQVDGASVALKGIDLDEVVASADSDVAGDPSLSLKENVERL